MKKIIIILVSTLIFLTTNFNISASCEEYSFGAVEYYNRGITQYQAKSYRLAISSFQKATQIEPTFVDAYYNMAEIYKYLDEDANAIATYAKLIKIQPDDYDAVLEIAKVYYSQGSYTVALKYLSDIPSSYTKYQEVIKLQQDASDSIKLRQEKIASSKNTADPNKKTFIDKVESPTGITSDSLGNLYIADYATNCIFKISPDKKKVLFAKNTLINGPIGLTADKFDNIYVANYETDNILKISPTGNIYVFINKINKPYYLYIKNDVLYISEQGSNTVIKYSLK